MHPYHFVAALENHSKGSVPDQTCFVKLVVPNLLHISQTASTTSTYASGNHLAIIFAASYVIFIAALNRKTTLFHAISCSTCLQKVSHSCFCFLCDQTTAGSIQPLKT